MADKNDESVGETTLVRNILEDLDTFVGGKKRGLNENNKPEARADNLKSTNSTTSSASNENKQYQGVKTLYINTCSINGVLLFCT